MEGALERDEGGAAGGVAGQLHRAFDRLGAGVAQKDPLLLRPRRDARQPLAESGHALVVEIAAADVQELGRRRPGSP